MADRPLLIFPAPSIGKRVKKKLGFVPPRLPSYSKQKKAIGRQFKTLEKALKSQAASLQDEVAGAVPEQVVVLETVGSVSDFYRAVERIPGLEWLVELEDEVEADKGLFDDDVLDETVSGRLFLVMANQGAMKELLALWKLYQTDQGAAFPWGLAKFRDLFKLLKGVRTWSANDRITGTGLDEFVEGRLDPEERVKVEVELWYRRDKATRERITAHFRNLLAADGGVLVSEVAVESIRYHGILAELPVKAVQGMLATEHTRLVICEDVMFFRPASQFLTWTPTDASVSSVADALDAQAATGQPIVAILDGLPLENHAALRGQLIVDDPDGWAARYPVDARYHGTAMASLVVRGDLHVAGGTLGSPVYVRPVLLPVGHFAGSYIEQMPDDRLPVDLVHRAVLRMFERDGETEAAAPSVRIVNFSIGDPARHFATDTSPLARLLDWLAWKYRVLFVVSAGNHSSQLELDVSREQFAGLSSADRQRRILGCLARNAAHRRLLSPAESVNALTVGACHSDAGPMSNTSVAWNPYTADGCVSPISAFGRGYNRAVKPEVLADGGRLHFRDWPSSGENAVIKGVVGTLAPGQLVAMPASGGELGAIGSAVGTSNAAALATRAAAQFHSATESLRRGPHGERLDPGCAAALMKAAIVHSSSWGGAQDAIRDALSGTYDKPRIKDMTIRALGYGRINPSRVLRAGDERATLLGSGWIGADEAHEFYIPLPPSLAGKKIWRRVTLTLAWVTPVNANSRVYRQGLLFFAPRGDDLQVARSEVDWQTVRRGTVQHEVLEGDKASAFTDGAQLAITINCKSDRARLKEKVPYGILASLEVSQAVGIPVYAEVRERLRARVAVAPSVG